VSLQTVACDPRDVVPTRRRRRGGIVVNPWVDDVVATAV
jgi:hypothetical protein